MSELPTLQVFRRARRDQRPLVVVTAYDVPTARAAAAGGVDALLVGDSLGQVLLGHETTLTVTVDEMLHHARAVNRAATGLPMIVDLPYGSFHVDPCETVRHALRLVREGGRRRSSSRAAASGSTTSPASSTPRSPSWATSA